MTETAPEYSADVNAFLDKQIASLEKRLVDINKYIQDTINEIVKAQGAAAECEFWLASLRKERKTDALTLDQLKTMLGADSL